MTAMHTMRNVAGAPAKRTQSVPYAPGQSLRQSLIVRATTPCGIRTVASWQSIKRSLVQPTTYALSLSRYQSLSSPTRQPTTNSPTATRHKYTVDTGSERRALKTPRRGRPSKADREAMWQLRNDFSAMDLTPDTNSF